MDKYVIYEQYDMLRAGKVEKETKSKYRLTQITGCLRSFANLIHKDMVKVETYDCQKVIRAMFIISLLYQQHNDVIKASEKSFDNAIKEVFSLMAKGAGMQMVNVAPPYSEITHSPGPSREKGV